MNYFAHSATRPSIWGLSAPRRKLPSPLIDSDSHLEV